MKLVEVIAKGKMMSDRKDKAEIHYGDYVVVLSMNKHGNKENWLVSGYRRVGRSGGGHSVVQRYSKAYAPQAYNDVRQEVGASASNSESIDQENGSIKFSKAKDEAISTDRSLPSFEAGED